MKGDTTRKTFRKSKHYSGVLKQQGRVDVDSDWNEQVEIEDHLRRKAVKDTLGCCAAPVTNSAFQVSLVAVPTDDDELRLKLSAGRMYVDGILCENDTPAVEIKLDKNNKNKVQIISQGPQDLFGFKTNDIVEIWEDGSKNTQILKIIGVDSDGIALDSDLISMTLPLFLRRIVTYDTQDDYSEAPTFDLNKKYLIYLDVWQRHITAIEDKNIHEIALCGPDTATRIKTVWQAKLAFLPSDSTNDITSVWTSITEKRNARMTAWVEEPEGWDDCSLSPAARYRGLGNQLYRLEIHDEGRYVPKESDWFKVSANREDKREVELTNPGNSQWRIGQLVELSKDGKSLGLSRIIENNDNKFLSLDREVSDQFFIRKVATYKWSRDNGSVLRSVNSIDNSPNQIIISVSGQDIPQVFATGQWVEVTDEGCDLREEPGVLVRLKDAKGNVLDYDSNTMVCIKPNYSGKLSENFPPNSKLKVRLWDHVSNDPTIVIDSGSLELEHGINIQFYPGDEYKTGDYWQIPARSIDGSIEWPSYVDKDHVFVQRHGIKHHYCRLATYNGNGSEEGIVQSQNQFLPFSETITLSYVGGDAQEGFPGESLDRPLEVAIYKGGLPLRDATIVFTADSENGILLDPKTGKTGGSVESNTDFDGIAKCFWTLENNSEKQIQNVTATLSQDVYVDYNYCSSNSQKDWPDNKQTIHFHARLSTVSLEYISGDAQEVMPGEWLSKPLEIAVFKGGLPHNDAIVNFEITDEGEIKSDGKVVYSDGKKLSVKTDPNGIAECEWKPENNYEKPCQQIEVSLNDYILENISINYKHCPKIVLSAHLNIGIASNIAFDVNKCTYIDHYCKNKNIIWPSVQDAIDALCSAKKEGGCTVVVQLGEDLVYVISTMLDNLRESFPDSVDRDICICLLPGNYYSKTDLNLEPKDLERVNLKISGCGEGSRIIVDQGIQWVFSGIESIKLKDLKLHFISSKLSIFFENCGSVEMNSCHLTGFAQKGITLKALNCKRLLLKDSRIRALSFRDVNLFINELLSYTDETKPQEDVEYAVSILMNLFGNWRDDESFTIFAKVGAGEIYDNVSVDNRINAATYIENKIENLYNVDPQKYNQYKELLTSIISINRILPKELSRDVFIKMMYEMILSIHNTINEYFGIALCLPRKQTGKKKVIEEVTMENCAVFGTINLYADEWSYDLNVLNSENFIVPEMERLMHDASGSLSIQNSHLLGIIITSNLSEILERKCILFRNIFLSNSVIEPGWIRLVGQDIKLTSDFFVNFDVERIYSFIVCSRGILTGNSSDKDSLGILTRVLSKKQILEAADINIELKNQ